MALLIINSTRVKSPTPAIVKYHGHLLPTDKQPIQTPTTDPTVSYHGKKLPQDHVSPPLAPPDPSNNPSLIIINGFTLPPDTHYEFEPEKIIARDRIFDGIPVFEHIAEEAVDIQFEGKFRFTDDHGTTYQFPQSVVENWWTTVYKPNSVLGITNTFLNNLGIMQLVVRKAKITPIKANTDVSFRIECWENVVGQSLIVNP